MEPSRFFHGHSARRSPAKPSASEGGKCALPERERLGQGHARLLEVGDATVNFPCPRSAVVNGTAIGTPTSCFTPRTIGLFPAARCAEPSLRVRVAKRCARRQADCVAAGHLVGCAFLQKLRE